MRIGSFGVWAAAGVVGAGSAAFSRTFIASASEQLHSINVANNTFMAGRGLWMCVKLSNAMEVYPVSFGKVDFSTFFFKWQQKWTTFHNFSYFLQYFS